jgi:large subunit ribosomal protein L4
MWQAVKAYLSNQRQATASTKSRSDVAGGGRKPWRQKGTGRARAGTIRSPIWVGGGRAFAARPRSFEQKVNRKMYRAALRSMFSELLRQERLVVTQEFAVSAPKTKELKVKLNALGFDAGLVVVDAFDVNLWLAARNLPHLTIIEAQQVDPVSLIGADKVLVTAAALKIIEGRLR